MKKSILLLLLTGFVFNIIAQAQEEEPKYGITFTGFVKNDFIFDTRQTVSAREGHFLLYPANVKEDPAGDDINARSSFNYLSIQTRLTGTITGPDAFGAKTSGKIEGAFFGHANSDINGFRLRHAYIKLNWTNTEVILGQYWHLMFVTGCFPGTVSFNTGVPFQYFSRNPQIRISHKVGALTLTGAVATQRDFASPGGSDVLRNALLPDLQGQMSYSSDNLLLGVGAGYKQLLPHLETDSAYKTDESIGGFTAQSFVKYVTNPVTIKIEGAYAQNGYDGLFIGGFAVKSITDSLRDYREYTTINTLSLWTDIHTNGKNFQFGIFAGYSKNLGSMDEIDDLSRIVTYTRGSNIAAIYRVSPRFIVNSGKTRFALELEHTGADYSKSYDNKGVPKHGDWVTNNRVLVAAYYFF